MRLDLVNLPALTPSAAAAARLIAEQRVGAVLEAIAVRDAKSGQLWLDIGGQRHPARVASGDADGPQDGEKLQVRVLRNSPVLALETLNTRRPAPSAEAVIVADALRRFVPRQESAAPLVANVAWLANNKADVQQLPQAVAQALARLWQALPQAQTLSDPAVLARTVLRSGAFLEQQLASGAAPQADLKALLLELRGALREAGARPEAARADNHHPAPTPLSRAPLTALPSAPATLAVVDAPEQQMNELARQTDGALARLTTTQLAGAPQDGAPQPLLIELPVRVEDRATLLRLRIERDGSQQNAEGADAWTVEAALELGVAGGLHARVTLQGRRIGVQFRADSPELVQQLSVRAGQLESLLRESGLQVDRVMCLHGLPKGDAGQRAVRLLDVRA